MVSFVVSNSVSKNIFIHTEPRIINKITISEIYSDKHHC